MARLLRTLSAPRSRRAALTDLLLAYLIIVLLAVLVYVYFAHSFPTHIFNVHISQESYQKDFVRRDVHFSGHLNRWGNDDHILNNNEIREIGFPVYKTAQELTTDVNMLPIESYLGDEERPAVCDGCFTYNIQNIITNNVCSKTNQISNVDLLVLIFSSAENAEKRKAIRQTWLSPHIGNKGRVRHLFLLGLSELIEYDAQIQRENKVYRDILQGDFIEDYHNLTYKTLMGLKWSTERCQTARLIAKVDDDIWLNTEPVLEFLRFNAIPFSVGGKCLYGSKPARNPDSKWYASYQSFPEAQYPPFCVGPGYLITMSTAVDIVRVSKNVPYFHLEDVYIGMCLQQIGRRAKTLLGFLTVGPVGGHICRNRHPTIILVHGLTPEVMKILWGTTCRTGKRQIMPRGLVNRVRPGRW